MSSIEDATVLESPSKKALITFIIPTIGRPTLVRTLESIQQNTDDDWNAIVMFDGIEPTLESEDPRIRIMSMEKIGKLNYAGRVRNQAICFAETEWIGFVDDDDIIKPTYVSHLKKHISEDAHNVIIFRMQYNNNNGYILPPAGATMFEQNQVGISFCVKKNCFTEDNIWFEPGEIEDFNLLTRLWEQDKTIMISPYVNYIVRPDINMIEEIVSEH
jgi:glycosyltransferase involved in cell wall biosynthesis